MAFGVLRVFLSLVQVVHINLMIKQYYAFTKLPEIMSFAVLDGILKAILMAKTIISNAVRQ